jgi:hypothetical protein
MLRLLTIYFLIICPLFCFSQQFSKGKLIGDEGFSYGQKALFLNYNKDKYPDLLAFPFVHINDSDGNKEETIQLSDIENVESVNVADFNQDGLDDLVVLLDDGSITIFMNSRIGFKELPQKNKIGYYRLEYADIHIADVNADGNLDFAINRFGSNIMVYTGDGKGQFEKFSDFVKLFGNFGFITSNDIDGDGIEEIISDYTFAENDERKTGVRISVFSNGRYIEKNKLVLKTSVDVFYIEDIDQDGDKDFIYSTEHANGIYWSELDSNGDYLRSHKIETEVNPIDFYLVDMDGDNDLDIVKNTKVGPVAPSKNYVLENTGKGLFSAEKRIIPKEKSAYIMAVDLNGDQKGDVIEFSTKNGYRISVGINKNQNIEYLKDWVVSGSADDFDFMDINGDGIKDIIVASGKRLFYYEVSKKGKFSEEKEIATNEFFFNKFYLADLDNDGLIDLFWWDERSKINRVGWYKNLGMGHFESQDIKLIETRVADANLIDFDGDNDLDIVAYELRENKKYGFYVYPNEDGKFSSQPITVTQSDKFKELFVFDVNLDGRADIVDLGSECKSYSYAGNNQFSGFKIPFIENCSRFTSNLQIVDIDNDNVKDILIDQKNQLNWSKVDSNNQTLPLQVMEETIRTKDLVYTGDIDNDGDNDIICRTSDYVMVDPEYFTNKYNLIWLENDGKGRFGVHHISKSNSNSRNIKLFDIDGDGDLDVFQSYRMWQSSGLFMYRNNQKK